MCPIQADFLLQITASLGQATAHLTVDKVNRLIYVSNYNGENFVAFRLVGADYVIGGLTFLEAFLNAGSGVNPDRQEKSHIHGSWVYRDKFVYVADLGADKIYHYEVVNESLRRAPSRETIVSPGRGPRHIAIDNQNGVLYLLNELQPFVDIYLIGFEEH